MVGGIAHSGPGGHLPLGIDHVVGAVAQQELGVDVPGRPGEHKGGPALFEQGGGLQGTLEIVADGHHAKVKVPHPQGTDELLVVPSPIWALVTKGRASLTRCSSLSMASTSWCSSWSFWAIWRPNRPRPTNNTDFMLKRFLSYPTVTDSWGYWDDTRRLPAVTA